MESSRSLEAKVDGGIKEILRQKEIKNSTKYALRQATIKGVGYVDKKSEDCFLIFVVKEEESSRYIIEAERILSFPSDVLMVSVYENPSRIIYQKQFDDREGPAKDRAMALFSELNNSKIITELIRKKKAEDSRIKIPEETHSYSV